jgi:hypothetical protein
VRFAVRFAVRFGAQFLVVKTDTDPESHTKSLV